MEDEEDKTREVHIDAKTIVLNPNHHGIELLPLRRTLPVTSVIGKRKKDADLFPSIDTLSIPSFLGV